MEIRDGAGIPEGMVLIKKGGRPRSEARNIAVFMTRLWRTELLGESVKAADAWILDHWKSRNGITEESTIRRAIRAAKDGPLRSAVLYRVASSFNPATGEFNFNVDAPIKIQMLDDEPMIGSTVWTWTEGAKYASAHKLESEKIEFVVVDDFE